MIWTKVAIDAWTSAAGLADGYLFRPVERADRTRALTRKIRRGVL